MRKRVTNNNPPTPSHTFTDDWGRALYETWLNGGNVFHAVGMYTGNRGIEWEEVQDLDISPKPASKQECFADVGNWLSQRGKAFYSDLIHAAPRSASVFNNIGMYNFKGKYIRPHSAVGEKESVVRDRRVTAEKTAAERKAVAAYHASHKRSVRWSGVK